MGQSLPVAEHRQGTTQALLLLCTWHCHCERQPEPGRGANTALPRRAALCPSVLSQHQVRMGAHSSRPSNRPWQFWQRHVLQRALTQRAREARVPVGQEHAPAQDRRTAGWGCCSRHRTTAQTQMQAHPLRSGITAKTPRGRAQGTQASLPRGRRSSSGCSRASPSLPSPRAAAPTLQELYRKSPGRADCQLTELFSQQPAREERPPASILPGSFPWYLPHRQQRQGKKRSLAPQALPKTLNTRSIHTSEKFVELCTQLKDPGCCFAFFFPPLPPLGALYNPLSPPCPIPQARGDPEALLLLEELPPFAVRTSLRRPRAPRRPAEEVQHNSQAPGAKVSLSFSSPRDDFHSFQYQPPEEQGL